MQNNENEEVESDTVEWLDVEFLDEGFLQTGIDKDNIDQETDNFPIIDNLADWLKNPYTSESREIVIEEIE